MSNTSVLSDNIATRIKERRKRNTLKLSKKHTNNITVLYDNIVTSTLIVDQNTNLNFPSEIMFKPLTLSKNEGYTDNNKNALTFDDLLDDEDFT